MSFSLRLGLALLPLAAYFFLLGTWHARPRPTVVPGPRDFLLLALGFGGLIAFGPVGELLILWIFPRPSIAAWMAVASLVGLIALAGSLRARRRVIVYHADSAALGDALALAFEEVAGPSTPTPHGLQDRESRRGLHVETGRRLGTGTVETYGESPEALAEALAPVLAARLASSRSPRSRLATFWYGLAFLTLTVAALATALTRPDARAEVRRLRGR